MRTDILLKRFTLGVGVAIVAGLVACAGVCHAAVRIIPATIEFSETPIHQQIGRPVVIRNDGATKVTVQLSLVDPDSGFKLDSPASVTIGPGGAIQQQITFHPAQDDRYRAVLFIGSGDAILAEAAVLGVGVTVRCTPQDLQLQQIVGHETTGQVVCENWGDQDLDFEAKIEPLPLGGGGDEAFSLDLGKGRLPGYHGAPGRTGMVIGFHPMAPGRYDGRLVLRDQDSGKPLATSGLYGDGVRPRVTCNPLRLDLGEVPRGSQASGEIRCNNPQGSPVMLALTLLNGNGAWTLEGPSLLVPAGSTASMAVRFAPDESTPLGQDARLLQIKESGSGRSVTNPTVQATVTPATDGPQPAGCNVTRRRLDPYGLLLLLLPGWVLSWRRRLRGRSAQGFRARK